MLLADLACLAVHLGLVVRVAVNGLESVLCDELVDRPHLAPMSPCGDAHTSLRDQDAAGWGTMGAGLYLIN